MISSTGQYNSKFKGKLNSYKTSIFYIFNATSRKFTFNWTKFIGKYAYYNTIPADNHW